MLNYEVDPAILASLVPRDTVLDTWCGRTFVSVVGFRFLRSRVLGFSVPLHRDFDEVNLRFYVRAEASGQARRGVVFIREIVPRRAIALMARLAYNEPYIAVPMRSATPAQHDSEPGRVEYAWRSAAGWNRLSLEAADEPAVPQDESEEEFITEHYWGYTRQRDGGTVEYEVAHPRWRVWRSLESSLECDVSEVYGEEFAETLAAEPSSAFLAEGSEITVYAPRRLRARV